MNSNVLYILVTFFFTLPFSTYIFKIIYLFITFNYSWLHVSYLINIYISFLMIHFVYIQLARKRHIGNSSVTFIFVEEDAMPFQPDTIISGFQKVFIIVKYIRLNNDVDDNNNYKFGYR